MIELPLYADILTLDRVDREARQLFEIPVVWNDFVSGVGSTRNAATRRRAFRRLVKMLEEGKETRLPYRDMSVAIDDEEFVRLQSEPEQVIEQRMRCLGVRRWGMFSPAGDLTVTAARMVYASRADGILSKLSLQHSWMAEATDTDVRELITACD